MAESETKSLTLTRQILVSFQAPPSDVDRIMEAVTMITSLTMGKYDSNAYQSAGGIERYRPLEGAAAGAETELRKRPDIVEISFELPDDEILASRVAETIFQVHSYQEPVIRIQHI